MISTVFMFHSKQIPILIKWMNFSTNGLKKINRELETTFIFSTHDAKIVNIADHVIRLRDGMVIENRRSGEDIFEENAFTASAEN